MCLYCQPRTCDLCGWRRYRASLSQIPRTTSHPLFWVPRRIGGSIAELFEDESEVDARVELFDLSPLGQSAQWQSWAIRLLVRKGPDLHDIFHSSFSMPKDYHFAGILCLSCRAMDFVQLHSTRAMRYPDELAGSVVLTISSSSHHRPCMLRFIFGSTALATLQCPTS